MNVVDGLYTSLLKARTTASSFDALKLEKNKELVRQYFDLFNELKIEKMQELILPKHRFASHISRRWIGLEWNGHRELLSSVCYTAFSDFRLDIEEMIAGGNKV